MIIQRICRIIMSKKSKIVPIRITEDDLALIKEKIKDDKAYGYLHGSGQNVSLYIRNCIYENLGKNKKFQDTEIQDLNYQIRKIGVNINQVAAKVNAGYKDYSSAVSEILNQQKKIEYYIKKLSDMLEDS